MKTLIWGGWVIDPANGINEQRNLLVEDGKILWAGKEMPEAHRTVDATGLSHNRIGCDCRGFHELTSSKGNKKSKNKK